MNPAPSTNLPRRRPGSTKPGLALRWVAYVLVVAGLRVLAYRWSVNEMFLVPLGAELVLVKSAWTTTTFAGGWFVRGLGLALGNALAHRCYLIPAIYHDHEPWPEEFDWLCIGIAVQVMAVTVPFWIHRRIERRQSAGRGLEP